MQDFLGVILRRTHCLSFPVAVLEVASKLEWEE